MSTVEGLDIVYDIFSHFELGWEIGSYFRLSAAKARSVSAGSEKGAIPITQNLAVSEV